MIDFTQNKVEVGDKIVLKKQHPCGGLEWEVLRIGVDFRIKCTTCGKVMLIPREQIQKRIKKIIRGDIEIS